MKTVKLDIDAVIADCSAGMGDYHNVLINEVPCSFEHDVKLTKKQIKQAFADEDYWINLKPYPWARDLVELVNRHAFEWNFLTKAVADCPRSFSGKCAWINKHFPEFKENLFVCSGYNKHYACRGVNDLLIDDNPFNISSWEAAGGSTFYWKEVEADASKAVVAKRFKRIEKILTTV